jgi:tRNA (mo5U34)-methyltransferase
MSSIPLGDLRGRAFLDVGCWEGDDCVRALKAGAALAHGIDARPSNLWADRVRDAVPEGGHRGDRLLFSVMDALGSAFAVTTITGATRRVLRQYDVVLCAGVLYHVQDPMRLLHHLRAVTRERLILETLCIDAGGAPALFWRPPGTNDNPSNWWVPNLGGLYSMLWAAGFDPVARQWNDRDDRITVQCEVTTSEVVMPRLPGLMDVDREERDR